MSRGRVSYVTLRERMEFQTITNRAIDIVVIFRKPWVFWWAGVAYVRNGAIRQANDSVRAGRRRNAAVIVMYSNQC